MTLPIPGSAAAQAPTLARLVACPQDVAALESLMDSHLWIIEEELRASIGLPPWFDSALCFVLAEIVPDLPTYRPQSASAPQWIRKKARRVGKKLERTLAKRHVKNGLVSFTGNESFPSVLGLLLERHRPLYWEEFRRPRSFGPRCGTLGDCI